MIRGERMFREENMQTPREPADAPAGLAEERRARKSVLKAWRGGGREISFRVRPIFSVHTARENAHERQIASYQS